MLKPKALGLVIGILWAIWWGWAGLWGSWAKAWCLISSCRIYFGWFGLSWAGLVIGWSWASSTAFICGVIFAWLYNKFAA